MSTLAHLSALESALTAEGFPPMSAWWESTLQRFYNSGRRQLVLRVGRRGGKSSTLCRVAVLEALYGAHTIPPGDVGVVAIVSVRREEAAERLRTVRAILDALGVTYRPVDGGLELIARRVLFRVFTASVSGVSGFTCIAAICDEVAKWRDLDTGSNPAKEVLASLRPTIAGQPSARIFLSSSPLGQEDAHAAAFDAGDTAFQLVAFAETWTARPSLTEDETRALEPDERVWRREYAALPQAGASAAFDPLHIERAIGQVPQEGLIQCAKVVLVDPSAGASDTWSYAVCGWRFSRPEAQWQCKRVWSVGARKWLDVPIQDAKGDPIPNPDWDPSTSNKLVFDYVGGVDNAVRRGVTSDAIVRMIADLARTNGAVAVHGDQFERFGLTSAFATIGLPYFPHVWTQPMKEQATMRVRRWFADDIVALPRSEVLRTQLLCFSEIIAPSGAITFKGRRGGHDDYAMLLLLAAFVDMDGGLPGSPIAPRGTAYHFPPGFTQA
jgi:hypothetical protein